LSGATASSKLRASAVGVPEAFAPDEAPFAEAWTMFVAGHLSVGRTPWGRLVRGAARLRGTAEPEGDETTVGWDPARITRHLERTLRGAGQLVRRARILTILSESNVTFREVGAPSARSLAIRKGAIEAGIGGDGAMPLVRLPWRDRQRLFDAGAYDRLRVLLTELVRVHGEGGEVTIAVFGAELTGEGASRLLRVV
jgi:hypothetical protein